MLRQRRPMASESETSPERTCELQPRSPSESVRTYTVQVAPFGCIRDAERALRGVARKSLKIYRLAVHSRTVSTTHKLLALGSVKNRYETTLGLHASQYAEIALLERGAITCC